MTRVGVRLPRRRCAGISNLLKEVSSSGVRLIVAALERLKIDLRPIFEGLPFSPQAVAPPGSRIDWDDWVTIVERIERTLGGPLALADFAGIAAESPVGIPFHRVAQLLSTPTALYRLNSRWGIPSHYRNMRSECVELASDRLHITMSIPTHYRGSTAVFHMSCGVLRVLPKLVGLPESKILSCEVTSHSVSIVLKPPPARTLLSYAGRFARRVQGLQSMIEQLGEQELELDEKRLLLERRIAQQQVIEAALRVSEERWRSLAENAPGIILLLCAGGTIQSANRAFHGRDPLSLTGRTLTEMVAPQHREELATAIAAVRRDLTVRDVQLSIVETDGTELWYSCRLGPMGVPGEGPVTLSAFLTDITVRLRAEESLRERDAELARAQRLEALGRLAGGVAHDFNNILTVILGGIELVLDRSILDSELRDELYEIRQAGERAATLTRQLLAFSRQQVIAPEVLLLSDVIQQVRGMLSRLLGEDIQIEVRVDEGLWPAKLDRSQVEQILMNLVANARDAMPRGGSLTISARNVALDSPLVFAGSTAEPGSYVELSVEDTGLGMDVGTKSRIFEPFFSTKQRGRGTGLGLAIVRGIAGQSGGHVAVESELGRGTKFRLLFPRSREMPSIAAAADRAPPKGGRETILLVEDDPAIRDLARKILVDFGYRVIECPAAAEALNRAKCEPIDLLLTDVIMPEISGVELARLVAEVHPGLPVLFMSGYAEYEIVHRGVVDAGVVLLPKPFGPDSLARAVRKQLDENAVGARKSS
jgi:PAS domain S-box-containing protein